MKKINKVILALGMLWVIVLGINGFMVYQAIDNKPKLIANDYYEQSLVYDKWINARNELKKSGFDLVLIQTENVWTLSLVENGVARVNERVLKNINVKLRFIRLSHTDKDRQYEMKAMGARNWQLERPISLEKGEWKVLVELKNDDVHYAHETRHFQS